jgi:hypothetical protein
MTVHRVTVSLTPRLVENRVVCLRSYLPGCIRVWVCVLVVAGYRSDITGKTLVNVFAVMRPDILANENQIRNLIGEFELGRTAYKQQHWKKANKHFLACLTLKPEYGPSDLYLRRFEELSSEPHVPEWDRVYVFTHK